MKKFLTFMSLFFLCCVQANSLPAPTVKYKADRTIVTSQGEMKQKVYSSSGNERIEMEYQGMKSVLIINNIEKKGYMLMPEFKKYMQLNPNDKNMRSSTYAENVEIEKLNTTDFENSFVTKYKMISKDRSYAGYLWLNEKNIPIRANLISKDSGKNERFDFELTNIEIIEEDNDLFKVPSDFIEMKNFY